MTNSVSLYIDKIKNDRTKRSGFVIALLVLSLLTVTLIFWQFKLTGIALAGDTYCGKEEHTHTDECIRKELICTEDTEGHIHSPENGCFETKKTLICSEDEHTHGSDCFEVRRVLDCAEEHEHTDECYREESVLVCELPEHTHSDDCYDFEDVLVCTLEEKQPHVHTDACYRVEYICGKEEHTHTVDCYSDITADMESEEQMRATLPDRNGGETISELLVKTAESQLGYTESTRNYVLNEAGDKCGVTRYGQWYGNAYGDWNGMFVSFCLGHAGLPAEFFPQKASSEAFIAELDAAELMRRGVDGIESGDVVFFGDKVGILTEINDESSEVTAGDIDGIVSHINVENDDIIGYGDVSAAYERYAASCVLTFEGDGYRAVLSLSPEENIADGCTLEVLPKEGLKESAAALAGGKADFAEAFEINIKNGEESVSLKYSAKVEIIFDEPFAENSEIEVYKLSTGIKTESLRLKGDAGTTGVFFECSVPETAALCTVVEAEEEEKGAFDLNISVTNKNGDTLSGSEFVLEKQNEDGVTWSQDKTYISIENPGETATVSDLELGENYRLSELAAPDGYDAAKPLSFTLNPDGTLDSEDDAIVVSKAEEANYYLAAVNVQNALTDTAPTDAKYATTVSCNVKWSDIESNLHTSDSVTLRLYADGEDTGKTFVLNSTNNWSGQITNLWKYQLDSSGNPISDDAHLVKYSLVWDSSEDYGVAASSSAIRNERWVKADDFESGSRYAIVYSASGASYAVANNSSTTLERAAVTISNNEITSSVSDGMIWIPSESGSAVKLQNQATGYYLRLYRSNNTYSWRTGQSRTGSGTDITYNTSNGRISATNNSTRYMQRYNTATNNTSNATSYTLYKHIEEDAGLLFTINYQKIVEVDPSNPGKAPVFDHEKTIDYLGDGEANPDTPLAGDDFYRLYLNMTGKQEPVDLLIVVDQSNSMQQYPDMKFDGQSELNRIDAIKMFLGGTDSTEGFIKTYMDLNPENRYAVVGYGGQFYKDRTDNSSGSFTNTTASSGYTYHTDAEELIGWTNESDADAIYQNINNNVKVYIDGTNYEAGLLMAKEVFDKSPSNRRKIMIFMSDGAPTYYIDDNGDRQGTGSSNSTQACKEPSKTAFDDFRAAYPDVVVYTIGVSKDISEENTSTSQTPDVLKYMAKNEEAFFAIDSDMTTLRIELSSLFYPKAVTIRDDLSKYVRYYDDKPDVKVEMKNLVTGEITVLWENGKNNNVLDEKGNPVFERVEYIPSDTSEYPTGSTGTVKAVFGQDYCMTPNNEYSLSFNVRLTATASSEYAESGYGGVVGDSQTDFLVNDTSSEKDGFYSNFKATATYTITGETYRMEYHHPVVQVATPKTYDLTVIKAAKDSTHPIYLSGAQFELWRPANEDESGVPVEGLEGLFILVDGNIVTDESGSATVEALTEGTYYIIETREPKGYIRYSEPIEIFIGEGGVKLITLTDMAEGSDTETVLTVKNRIGTYELPETGGIELIVYAAGAGLAASAAAGMMYRARKRRRA